jgi:uncharacterized protein
MEISIIPIDDQDHYIIYRPLLGLAFIGNQAMAELCQQWNNARSKNKDENFEVKKFLSDIGYFLPEKQPYKPDRILSTAVLLLTNQCQLRCTYCYAAAGEASRKALSIETGKTAIDYVVQQASSHGRKFFTVDFHGGGEPSYEWDLLQALTRYARNKPLPVKTSLTSNAIWSEKQLEWIVQNIDRLSISMDGDAETQNLQRPLENNRPSFDIVFRNLALLDKAEYQYGIRMTVCPPWNKLKDNVKFISENTKCRSLQVEPAFNLLRGAHTQPDENQYHQFADAYLEAYEVALQYGTKLLYSGSRPGIITNVFCSAPYNALVVNPDNQIVACYEITNSSHPLAAISTFGQIKDGEIQFDLASKTKFYQLLQERFDKTCKDCFCRWTCAGDCYTRAFYRESDYLTSGERCVMNKEITKNVILSLISKHDGVWRSKPPQGKAG